MEIKDVEATKLDGDALIMAIRNQVEYYFSKDNLKSDTYLVSQMDANGSVPLNIVMKFAKLSTLTQDEQVVKQALDGSSSVSLQDGRIKSNVKVGRSTIILREIPSDAPEAEVREIFSFEGCKLVTSLRSEIGDTWFVTMESEDDAKDAILDLKLKKRTFRGAAVKARLKTEAVVKSYYNGAPSVQYAPMPYPVFVPETNYSNGQENPVRSPTSPDRAVGDKREDSSSRTHGPRGDGKDKKYGGNGQANPGVDRSRIGRTAVARDSERRGKGKDQPQGAIEINAYNFPPLPIDESHLIGIPGYYPESINPNAVKKYTIDEIINIVREIRDAPLPATIKPIEHPLAMVEMPNVDLLLRQRTFSIDETREQMQLGRPVLREAVAEGTVDYSSMMYGEDVSGASHHPQVLNAPQQKSIGGSWAGVLKSAPAPVSPTKVEHVVSVPKANEKKAIESTTCIVSSSSAIVSTPVNEKPEKKSAKTETSTTSGKKAEKKHGGGKKKADKDVEAMPSTWGGKLTFANVLKQSDPVPTPSNPTGATENNRPKSSDGKSNNSQKGRSHNSNTKKDESSGASAATWAKAKLPPVEGKSHT